MGEKRGKLGTPPRALHRYLLREPPNMTQLSGESLRERCYLIVLKNYLLCYLLFTKEEPDAWQQVSGQTGSAPRDQGQHHHHVCHWCNTLTLNLAPHSTKSWEDNRQTQMEEQLHTQKSGFIPLPLCTAFNSKWVHSLNVWPDTLQWLYGNREHIETPGVIMAF